MGKVIIMQPAHKDQKKKNRRKASNKAHFSKEYLFCKRHSAYFKEHNWLDYKSLRRQKEKKEKSKQENAKEEKATVT